MLSAANGDGPRSDGTCLLDRQLHSLGCRHVTEPLAAVEDGHRGRFALCQDLRPRIDAPTIDRVEIPPDERLPCE